MILRLNRGIRFSLLARARVRSPFHPTDIIENDSASRVRLCSLCRVCSRDRCRVFSLPIYSCT